MSFLNTRRRAYEPQLERKRHLRRLEQFVKANDRLPSIADYDSDLVMWTLRQQRLDEMERISGGNYYVFLDLRKMVDSNGNKIWHWVDAAEQFDACYSSLVDHIDEEGEYPSCGSGGSLKEWMVEQRQHRSSLSDLQRKKLEALPGWGWSGRFPGRAAIKKAREAGVFPPQDRLPAKRRDREEEEEAKEVTRDSVRVSI